MPTLMDTKQEVIEMQGLNLSVAVLDMKRFFTYGKGLTA